MVGNGGLRRTGRAWEVLITSKGPGRPHLPSYEPLSHGAIPPAFNTLHWPPRARRLSRPCAGDGAGPRGGESDGGRPRGA